MSKFRFASVAAVLAAITAGSVAPADTGMQFTSGGFEPYIFFQSAETGTIRSGGHDILIPSEGGREPMDAVNQPTRLHPALYGAIQRLFAGPNSGKSDRPIFASNWWPQIQNGIAARWSTSTQSYGDWKTDPEGLSPAEKYDMLFYPNQTQSLPQVTSWSTKDLRLPYYARPKPHVIAATNVIGPATAWELLHHGLYQSTYPDEWWGHCNGWASYVTAEANAAPGRDIRVKIDNNKLVECNAGETGCVLFRTADIEALLSELYFYDSSTVAGRRCEKEATAITRDVFGRPTDPACRDLNPATFHIALTGLLGVGASPVNDPSQKPLRLPFVMDYSADNEVWSFPVVSYQFDQLQEVDQATATQLICNNTALAGRCSNGFYPFDRDAVRFAQVTASYWLVNYAVDTTALAAVPLARNTKPVQTQVTYLLELDGRRNIIGGEWLDAPSLNIGSKVTHPDFLYMSVSPVGAGEQSDDRGGTQDNPYISYPYVKALLALSQRTSH
jgi:hypothetical protein